MAKGKNNSKEEPIEKQLWKAADKLRKNINASEYKNVVLGLIFLKYISDAFEELHDQLSIMTATGSAICFEKTTGGNTASRLREMPSMRQKIFQRSLYFYQILIRHLGFQRKLNRSFIK